MTVTASFTPTKAAIVASNDDSVTQQQLQKQNAVGASSQLMKLATDTTPLPTTVSRPFPVTPDRESSDNSLTSSSCTESLSVDETSASKAILKTAHKLLEEKGFDQPEPLLVENPRRFVLFPIQDNEVSAHQILQHLRVAKIQEQDHRQCPMTTKSYFSVGFCLLASLLAMVV